ncbi:hypothetical protein VP01_15268g1, partial [Puccinia sorghi]
NKLAGKQVSLGVMALTCLNLHPSIRYKPQYTFLAGIIPAPNQPDMVTISNVLRPIVDELLNLEKSIKVKTFCFPEGCSVSAKLGALIGDVVATHKVAGFSSHSASRFCSWCDVLNTNIGQMQMGRARTRATTLAAARRWGDA